MMATLIARLLGSLIPGFVGEAMNNSIRLLFALLLVTLPLTAPAQWNQKSYSDWTEKESLRLLDDSPWSQKQTFSDTSKMASTTTSRGGTQATIADVVHVTFHTRLFSARPVRQAISRLMTLQRKDEMPEAMARQLKAFAEADFPDYVVVTVTCEGSTSNLLQSAQTFLQKLKTTDLKNNTYLLTQDGRHIFISEYQSPRNDGFGARFVFPRVVEGKSLLTSDGGELIFHTELGGGSRLNSTIPNSDVAANGFTINTRFKVKDLAFGGKLEY